MSLSALPNEILYEICSYLERQQLFEPFHLGNFRLANTNFAAIGLRYLAREVTIFLNPWSLFRLLTFSSDSKLWNDVKSLRLSCSIYPSLGKNEDIRASMLKNSENHDFLVDQLSQIMYKSLRYTQQQLIEPRVYVSSLSKILPKLANLESIIISNEYGLDIGSQDINQLNMDRELSEEFLEI
ncbi:hypothetical protein MMC10_006651, partial [Thelotrema lepadinum]|nr:hypothetical protein [Thelotrema lepadinum]